LIFKREYVSIIRVVPHGSEDQLTNTIAIDITIWGVEEEKTSTLGKLSMVDAFLNVSVNPNESEENVKEEMLYYRDQWHVNFIPNHFKNLEEVKRLQILQQQSFI
jgi:hypothetical protein